MPIEFYAVEEFYSRIAGTSHANPDGTSRQELLRRCRPGERLALEREPNNAHDANAVKILRVKGSAQLGYVTARAADTVAAALDNGERVEATITEITGGTGEKPNVGANVRYRIGGRPKMKGRGRPGFFSRLFRRGDVNDA